MYAHNFLFVHILCLPLYSVYCPENSEEVKAYGSEENCGIKNCNVAVNTIQECQKKCEYNWKCLGFSWQVRGGSQNQKCILYWTRKPDDIPNENVKQIFCQLPIPNHNLTCPKKSIQIGRKHTVSGDGLDKNN